MISHETILKATVRIAGASLVVAVILPLSLDDRTSDTTSDNPAIQVPKTAVLHTKAKIRPAMRIKGLPANRATQQRRGLTLTELVIPSKDENKETEVSDSPAPDETAH